MTTRRESARSYALIIPTYRRPEFVRQAVDSALRQTHAFDEIVVVPDGVDDPAVEALHGLPVVVRPVPHAGVAAARNSALEFVTADWVCFLDDDDLLHPEYLADLDAAIEAAPESGAFNAPYWSFGTRGGPRDEFVATTLDECLSASSTAVPRNDMTYLDIAGHSFDSLLAGLMGSMSTAAVRADILREAGGFPEGLIAAEDWTMYVNVARYTEWRVLAERRAFFRDHGNNAMGAQSTLKALSTVRAICAFWQPTPRPTPSHRPLTAYRISYRYEVATALAVCRRNSDRGAEREVLSIARELLPRRWDRIFLRVPKPVRGLMWRLERMRR